MAVTILKVKQGQLTLQSASIASSRVQHYHLTRNNKQSMMLLADTEMLKQNQGDTHTHSPRTVRAQ
jgi:hypothetical protein